MRWKALLTRIKNRSTFMLATSRTINIKYRPGRTWFLVGTAVSLVLMLCGPYLLLFPIEIEPISLGYPIIDTANRFALLVCVS